MPRTFAVCFLVLISGCPQPATVTPEPPSPGITGTVTHVMDGDTVKLEHSDGTLTTVRLEGIDAPQSAQRFGDDAKPWLANAR